MPAKKKAVKSKSVNKKAVKKRVTKKKEKQGRPKYTPSEKHIETARIGAKKGLSEKEISKAIGISYACFQKYKKDFVGAIKKGHDESDDANCEKVENSLLKKALGYTYEEITKETRAGGEFGQTTIERAVIKHVQPSDTAIFFYLVNRKPERWQSVNKIVVDSKNSFGDIKGWFDEMKKEHDKTK